MVARQGRIAHHFAHHAEAGDQTCTSAGETALHKFAKQILNERLEILLPEMIVESNEDKETVVEEKRYTFNKAVLEKREGRIIPDVILILNDRRLIVEFKVTHACGEEKIHYIKTADIAAIEIDLSQYRGRFLSELADPILFQAPRLWLHNPRERHGLRRLEERRQERVALVRTKADKLKAVYANLTPPPNSGIGYFEELARRDGLEGAIGKEVEGGVCFKVPYREWQSYIMVEWVLQGRRGFHVDEVVRSLHRQSWIRPEFEDLSTELIAAGKLGGGLFHTPEDAVESFLKIAANNGFLRRDNKERWLATQRLREAIWAARQSRTDRANRLAEVRKVIEEILDEVPETELIQFNVEGWIRRPLPGRGYCPADAISFEYQPWMSFVGELKNLESSLLYTERMPSDLMGLPLRSTFERKLGARREAETQRTLAREARRCAEAESRVARIKQLAGEELAAEAVSWLVESNPNLGGLSPVEAAEKADDGLSKASAIIDRLVWDKRQKAIAQANKVAALELLRKEAEKRLPTKEHASLWMRSRLREVKNRSPQDHCVDIKTMQECISFLPAKRPRR